MKETYMTKEWYEKNAQNYYNRVKDINISALSVDFLRALQPSATILDAGCGIGNFTKDFIEKGYNVTAFDGSSKMVRLATKHCGQTVHQLTFKEIEYENQFDGIWAQASLLHVPRNEIQAIFAKFIKAMKKGGVWQFSFKYGSGERYQEQRFFNDYNLTSLTELINCFPSLEIIKIIAGNGLRPGNLEQYWIQALVKKK